jgi:hypothetical protein
MSFDTTHATFGLAYMPFTNAYMSFGLAYMPFANAYMSLGLAYMLFATQTRNQYGQRFISISALQTHTTYDQRVFAEYFC